MATNTKGPPRQRIGRVSLYEHHGQPWVYFRHAGEVVRRPVGLNGPGAEAVASLINAGLAADSARLDVHSLMAEWLPELTGPKSTATLGILQRAFLTHHEEALASARGTVDRYRTATDHLVRFAGENADAATIDVAAFVSYLRKLEVSPNGHANTAKRRLRDKGLQYVLQTCRSMLRFGQRSGLIAEGVKSPFSAYPIGRIAVRDRKPIFVFNPVQEEAFFRCAVGQAFAMHMVLAKTAQRPAELTHTLIEDVDLDSGWWHVRSKPELGWTTKTNRERAIPLVPEVVALLRTTIGGRKSGLVFVRDLRLPLVGLDQAALTSEAATMIAARPDDDRGGRKAAEQIYDRVWRAAGLVDTDRIRLSFIRTAKAAGLPPHATCPKSWRHTFATLLQQANVDLLIRQETLGHKPTDPAAGTLGMTGVYTHTDPTTQRQQIDAALRLRPRTLALIGEKLGHAIPEVTT